VPIFGAAASQVRRVEDLAGRAELGQKHVARPVPLALIGGRGDRENRRNRCPADVDIVARVVAARSAESIPEPPRKVEKTRLASPLRVGSNLATKASMLPPPKACCAAFLMGRSTGDSVICRVCPAITIFPVESMAIPLPSRSGRVRPRIGRSKSSRSARCPSR